MYAGPEDREGAHLVRPSPINWAEPGKAVERLRERPVGMSEKTLPEIAWRGLARRYRDLVGPCTEAPEAFHLASLIAAAGCLIGRKAWICTPHRTFPNFYCLLIGKTGHTRKTTAYKFALDLLGDASDLASARTKCLSGLASVEGLAAAMQDTEPYRVLCVEDELKTLIKKGGQKAVGNLIPKLTELYNCPATFEVNTKNSPILVREPFLCMLAASTRAWFEESLSASDVSGGFLNRWLVFEGGPGELLPFPQPVDNEKWQDLVAEICAALEPAAGCLEFSPPAKRLYEQFYARARRDYTSEATARMDLHAKKLGLLYALLAGHRQIEAEDMESGIAIAIYCAEVVEPLAEQLDVSPQKRLEERLLDALKDGPLSPRDAYRKLHVPAGDLTRAAGALQSVNQIALDAGRYRLSG